MNKLKPYLFGHFFIYGWNFEFLSDLDAINWEEFTLGCLREVRKFWSTSVDLLGNIGQHQVLVLSILSIFKPKLK